MNDEKPSTERLCPRLALACKKCGATGLIPWDRLDRVLGCRNCNSWYRVERGTLTECAPPEEKLQVAVRGGMSQWREHDLDPQTTQPRDWRATFLAPVEWLRFAGWRMRSAVGGGLAALILAALFFCSGRAAESTAATETLPTELTGRATLFAQAWLNRDLTMLLRLTDRSNDRQLRRWFAQSSPPRIGDGAVDPPAIDASIDRRQPHYAALAVKIRPAGAVTTTANLMQRQEWLEQNGVWYFLPRVAPGVKPRAR